MPDVTRFRSDLFPIEAGDDDQTNPFCYGRSLANWLRDRFAERGHPDAAVIAEDFGWCVMLQRQPALLWIGCSSELDDEPEMSDEERAAWAPRPEAVTWQCFVAAETPIWTSGFWKRLVSRLDPGRYAAEIEADLAAVLAAEPDIRLSDGPYDAP